MKMIKQRLMGLGLVAISALVVLMASGGTTPEDQDATAAVLIGPLGLCCSFRFDEEETPRKLNVIISAVNVEVKAA